MNILVIQNRMGIGDMVIFLPFIEAIAKKYKTPITLLIKENSKAKEYTKNLQFQRLGILLSRQHLAYMRGPCMLFLVLLVFSLYTY